MFIDVQDEVDQKAYEIHAEKNSDKKAGQS
jgi:hypothetical protein